MNEHDEEFVVCQLCFKNFGSISVSHLKKDHNISMNEYRKMFPAAELTTKLKRVRMSDSSKKSGCGKWLKGKKLSLERRQQMSLLSKGDKNKFYGKKHTEEARLKMSQNHADFNGDNNPLRNFLKIEENHKAYCEIIKSAKERQKLDVKRYESFRNKLSKSIVQGHIDGKFNSYGRGHKQGTFFSDRLNKQIYFRSSYEERFLKWCETTDLVFDTCKIAIEYIDEAKKLRRYLPDFMLNNRIVVELKPRRMIKTCFMKLIEGLKYCSNNDLLFVILCKHDLQELEKLEKFDELFFLQRHKTYSSELELMLKEKNDK